MGQAAFNRLYMKQEIFYYQESSESISRSLFKACIAVPSKHIKKYVIHIANNDRVLLQWNHQRWLIDIAAVPLLKTECAINFSVFVLACISVCFTFPH